MGRGGGDGPGAPPDPPLEIECPKVFHNEISNIERTSSRNFEFMSFIEKLFFLQFLYWKSIEMSAVSRKYIKSSSDVLYLLISP